MQDIREIFKNARITSQLHVDALGAKVGLSGQQVRNWENKSSWPPKHKFKDVCKALRLDPPTMLTLYFSERAHEDFRINI